MNTTNKLAELMEELGNASRFTEQGETFLRETNCKMEVLRAVPQTSPRWAKDGKHGTQWSITITREISKDFASQSKSINFPFWTSIRAKQDAQNSLIARAKEKPRAYDVLAGLYSENDSFEEFCGNFGYSEDSREAYSTWEDVTALNKKLESIFSKKELEALRYIV